MNVSEGGGRATARIDFVDTLRGLAVLLVLWDHLIGQYLTHRRQSWWPHTFISDYVNTPLGIIQDFGWFGVCLFFLISGYVITHVAQRESGRQFAIRRLLRIYPPLIAAIFLSIVLSPWSGDPFPKQWQDLAWGVTLLNYFRVPQNVVLGVAWTLVIEMIFYCLVAVQTFFFRRHNRTAVCLNLLACAAVIASCRRFGGEFFLFAASMAFIPYLIVGQIIYLRSRRSIGAPFAWAAGIAAFCVIQYGVREIHVSFLPLNNSYLISFVFALGLFLIAELINLKPIRPVWFSAQISYSLYLVHGPVGFAVLGISTGFGLSYTVSLILSVVAVFAVAAVLNRAIEKPSQALARRWTSAEKTSQQPAVA